MKFLIMLVTGAALVAPQTAEAHKQHRPNTRATVTVGTPAVSVTWVWVPATRVHRAHWSHPTHGRDFGPDRPVTRPHVNATWVAGHWAGQRRLNRRWVPGHWVRRAPAQNRARTRNQRRR
jgi:hypothetical protein